MHDCTTEAGKMRDGSGGLEQRRLELAVGFCGFCHFEFGHGEGNGSLELEKGGVRGINLAGMLDPVEGCAKNSDKCRGGCCRHIGAADSGFIPPAYSARCSNLAPGLLQKRKNRRLGNHSARSGDLGTLVPCGGRSQLARVDSGLHNTEATPPRRRASLSGICTPELSTGFGVQVFHASAHSCPLRGNAEIGPATSLRARTAPASRIRKTACSSTQKVERSLGA